jgi:hypothetical protein
MNSNSVLFSHPTRVQLRQVLKNSISKVFFKFGFDFLNCFNSIQTFSLICFSQKKISSSLFEHFFYDQIKFSHPKLVVLNYQQMSIYHHENEKFLREKLIDNIFNNRIKVDFVKEQRKWIFCIQRKWNSKLFWNREKSTLDNKTSKRIADLKNRYVTNSNEQWREEEEKGMTVLWKNHLNEQSLDQNIIFMSKEHLSPE